MRKNLFSHRGLILALAALLAVAAPGAPLVQAAARLSNAALLSSELPEGETLASAPTKDVDAAVRAAVAKRPAAAAAIVRLAIAAKTTKRHDAACEYVKGIIEAALAAAPDQGRSVMEMAQSMAPECADTISQVLRSNTPITGNGIATGAAVPGSTTGVTGTAADGSTATTTSTGDFGAGFGPGFPGSPGFSGSSPSGGFAVQPSTLPTPAPTPVTIVTNS